MLSSLFRDPVSCRNRAGFRKEPKLGGSSCLVLELISGSRSRSKGLTEVQTIVTKHWIVPDGAERTEF